MLYRNIGVVIDQNEHSIKVQHYTDTVYLPIHMYQDNLQCTITHQNRWTVLRHQQPPHT